MTAIFEPQWLVPLFAAFWFGGAAIMARLAGWAKLAAAFPASAPPTGESFRFVTAIVGSRHFPIKYRNCCHLVVADRGIYLSLMFPFKFQSPAFFVPWSAVENVVEAQQLSNRAVTLHFQGQLAQVTLRGPLGQLMLAAYNEATAENVASAGTQPGPT